MNKTEKNSKNNNNLLESFAENFDNISSAYTITQDKPEDDELLKTKTNLTLAKYAAIEQIPIDFAIIGISALLQSGAYLKSVPNRKIKINNHEFTKKSLVFAAEQAENKYTLRAMARFMKLNIVKVALTYNIPGHLFARYKIENASKIAQMNPEIIKTYSAYCTDFQIENPDCPEDIRQYLADREKNRSNNNNRK